MQSRNYVAEERDEKPREQPSTFNMKLDDLFAAYTYTSHYSVESYQDKRVPNSQINDGYGNVIVSAIPPVFTSNPIRSPTSSIINSVDNDSVTSLRPYRETAKPKESSWMITPPNSSNPSKTTSLASRTSMSRPSSRNSNDSLQSDTSNFDDFISGNSVLARNNERRSLDTQRPQPKLKILRNDLGAIEEEDERFSSLKRAFSLPGEVDKNLSLAMISMLVLKKNRRGIFQKRLIRFDGTLFICMSNKTRQSPTPIMDMDLLSSKYESIRDFSIHIRENYPLISTSLAKFMISSISSLKCKEYYIPKWVIPVGKVCQISAVQNGLRIMTEDGTFEFKDICGNETGLIKRLFERVMAAQIPAKIFESYTDSMRVFETQREAEREYELVQSEWKEALKGSEDLVTSLLVENEGLRVVRGMIEQRARRVRRNNRREHRYYVEPIKTSADISRRIEEIDKEIASWRIQ